MYSGVWQRIQCSHRVQPAPSFDSVVYLRPVSRRPPVSSHWLSHNRFAGKLTQSTVAFCSPSTMPRPLSNTAAGPNSMPPTVALLSLIKDFWVLPRAEKAPRMNRSPLTGPAVFSRCAPVMLSCPPTCIPNNRTAPRSSLAVTVKPLLRIRSRSTRNPLACRPGRVLLFIQSRERCAPRACTGSSNRPALRRPVAVRAPSVSIRPPCDQHPAWHAEGRLRIDADALWWSPKDGQAPGRFPVGMVMAVVCGSVTLFRNSMAMARISWSNM